MRTRTPRRALALLAVCLLSSLALAQKITTDYDHSADFSTYHTYAWTDGTLTQDPLTDQRIRGNIDQQLTSRGYRKVDDPTRADVLVTYDAALTQRVQFNTAGMGAWEWGWGMGSQITSSAVNYIPPGTLCVRIGDNRTHKIVWRGTASGVLNDKPERIAQQIQRSTARMFSGYPPKH